MITKIKTKNKNRITIIDYGVGNLYSVGKAFGKICENVLISDDSAKISSSDALVLPGVGSFEAGMKGLEIRNLTKVIKDFAETGKPILGICLGAQLMLKKGCEYGEFDGLGIINGRAVKFPKLLKRAKIPHIGWNKIKLSVLNSEDKLQLSVRDGSYFYFVHSYILEPEKKENILTETEYGGFKFCSMMKKGNIYGCQFHPEKSGQIGLELIEKFVSLVKQNATKN